jgi:phosphatidylglycerophosphate synthase
MNWANRLTVSRLGLTILFVLALNSEWPFAYTLALLLFIIAGITDYVDGENRAALSVRHELRQADGPARRQDHDCGGVHLARRAAGETRAERGAGMGGDRDCLAGIFDHRPALSGQFSGQVLPAEQLGKHKTSWQIITVIFFLLLLAVRERYDLDATTGWWLHAWSYGGTTLVWVTVALTLYSGLRYAWKHREVLATER